MSAPPKPLFFAPTAIQQLVDEWGPAAFATRLDTDLKDLTAFTNSWLHPDHRDGREATVRAFDGVAVKNIPPDRFVIVRPHANAPTRRRQRGYDGVVHRVPG